MLRHALPRAALRAAPCATGRVHGPQVTAGVARRLVASGSQLRGVCTTPLLALDPVPAPVVVDAGSVAKGIEDRTLVVFAAKEGDRESLRRDYGVPAAAIADFEGGLGEAVVAYPSEGHGFPARVVLCGLGAEEDAVKQDGVAVAQAAHHATARLRSLRQTDAMFIIPAVGRGVARMEAADVARQLAKGSLLSSYRYSRKAKGGARAAEDAGEEATKEKNPLLTSLTLVAPEGEEVGPVEAAVRRAHELARGVSFARALTNERADVATPEHHQRQLEQMVARFNAGDGAVQASVEALDHYQLRMRGLNMLASVGQAAKTSDSLPRLVVVEYRGRPDSEECVALVGKGVTFDSGGLNLKPTGAIEGMHMDMGGAAAVMGTLQVVLERQLPVNVVVAVALAENAIDALAYKPKSILQSLKGPTVEVGNTDAEGRLCLADAMTYVQQQYRPKALVDVATLTGACVVALGEYAAGLFSNQEELGEAIKAAGAREGEVCWPLPILPGHTAELKECAHADLSSTGSGREGGACTAAAFLQEFVEESVEWAHLDIAGAAMASKARGYLPAGGTGFGVQTLVSFLEQRASE